MYYFITRAAQVPRAASISLSYAAMCGVTLAALALGGCSSESKKPAPQAAEAHDEHAHKEGDEHAHEGEGADAHSSSSAVSNRIDIPEHVRRNLGITFAKVETRRVASTLRMPGRFELQPSAKREYSAPLAGRVELLVKQYDKISTGTKLYRLDSADWRRLKQEIAEARAQVGVTSAALLQAQVAQTGGASASQFLKQRIAAGARHVDSLKQTLAAAEARVTQVEQLQKMVGGKLAEVAEARSKVAEARTALTLAEEENADTQRETLKQSTEGGSSFATSASLQASYEARRAEYEAARIRLSVNFASAASILGRPTDEISAAVPSADADTTRPLWATVDQIEIAAASQGVVQSLQATNGAYVESAKPVITVADPSQVRFRGIALQSDLERLRDGMPARIIPPAGGGSGGHSGDIHTGLPGTLTFGQEADPDQRSLDVIITPEGEAHWAKAGVAAYAEAVTDDTEDPAAAIPAAAILQDDLDKIYFRRDPANPDKVIRMVADIGITDGQWVAIESGVKASDEVVLGGVYQLKLAGGGKATKAGHFHADGTFHEGKD